MTLLSGSVWLGQYHRAVFGELECFYSGSWSTDGANLYCRNPDGYVFWDGYGHPTTKVHEIIAKEVMKFIKWEG
jgi:hypothetical protein